MYILVDCLLSIYKHWRILVTLSIGEFQIEIHLSRFFLAIRKDYPLKTSENENRKIGWNIWKLCCYCWPFNYFYSKKSGNQLLAVSRDKKWAWINALHIKPNYSESLFFKGISTQYLLSFNSLITKTKKIANIVLQKIISLSRAMYFHLNLGNL